MGEEGAANVYAEPARVLAPDATTQRHPAAGDVEDRGAARQRGHMMEAAIEGLGSTPHIAPSTSRASCGRSM